LSNHVVCDVDVSNLVIGREQCTACS